MRNAISIFLLFILFLLTPVILLVTSARVNVLSAKFLTRELVKLDVYGVATSQIDAQLAKVVIDPQYPVTNQELTDLVHNVITETWLRQTVESSLGRMEEWLKAKPGTVLSVPIDLRQPKATLTAGVDALLTSKLPTIEPCPSRTIPKEEQGLCQFAGLTLPELKEQLRHAGLNPDVVSELLPDTLDLLNPDLAKLTGPADADDPQGAAAKSAEIKQKLEDFKAQYQRVVFLMNLALGIVGLLVALYLALNAVHGWHRLTRWGGVLFLVIGLLPYAMAVASTFVVERAILPNIRLDGNLAEDLTRLAPIAIRDVRKALFDPLLVFGTIGLVVGLGGIIGAHWVSSPRVKDTQHKS